ncbi:MAG: insulinase family protein [Erysipelotrichaceae bacterium]|nr:insulinase family protein [Erysipelotrichaceae bacterium]
MGDQLMNINDNIHGFRVINVRHSDELKADMYEFIHEKSGAKAIWLKRADENKTFSIAFKTTPVDDTGVFHILEHSVLNGSHKYPVKEPFVDLLKGSLQTFLNAITFPDKTVYPVSSRNDQDFVNLMRVYLDAVFAPLAVEKPYAFYQEGWHYEMKEGDEQPSYKGVVFNEMKGAFSSPDSLRMRYMMHALFPENCYGYESGGDPDHITDLSYEDFCAAHAKYYAPDNAYIFLDGDMEIGRILSIIDEEYLQHYDKKNNNISISRQEPVVADKVIKEFEIAAGQDPAGKAQIAYGYVVSDFDDYEKNMAFSLISSLLCARNESPLKQAILSKGLGEDVYFDIQDGILQPYVEIDVINTDLDKEEEIDRTIRKLLEGLVEKGLDKEELEAVLNQREFKAKERDFGGAPKGLVFALSSLDSWLYGGDPMRSICFEKLFNSLREKLHTSYYEDLLKETILESGHHAKILLKPSNTLGEQKQKNEKEKLAKICESWSFEQKQQILKMNEELSAWQMSSDTPEQKATLPKLRLEDLKKTLTDYPVKASSYGNNTVITHDQETEGISYLSLFLQANDLELKDYTVLSQMLSLLGKLKTTHYDPLTLNRLTKSILGDFYTSFTPALSFRNDEPRNNIAVIWSNLNRNDEEALKLVKEIIYETDFSDDKAIHDILKQNIFALEQAYINAGHSLALLRASAYSSRTAVISEYYAGYEAYRYLNDLDDHYEERKEDFLHSLKELQKKLFVKERYTLSVAGTKEDLFLKKLLDDAPSGTVGETVEITPLGHRKEAIIVPSNVSYAAKTTSLKEDIKKPGVMQVLSNILTYDYLWNEIRVKNGAYGCGFRCGNNKQASFYSYRDPSPVDSLRIYEETPDYLKDFLDHADSIDNYIVGTTGDFDPYMSVKSAIRAGDLEYLIDLTYDDKQKIYEQILDTTLDDLRDTIPLFEKINEIDDTCIVGNKDAIEKNSDTLMEVISLMK